MNRRNNEDISKDVLTISGKEENLDPITEESRSEITVFTINDKKDDVDNFGNPILFNLPGENAKDRKDACAMRIKTRHTEKLYIKRGGTGNKLLNLNDPFSIPDPKKMQNGIEVWQYREVNSTAFNLYVKFLKTKNPLFINQAEREII